MPPATLAALSSWLQKPPLIRGDPQPRLQGHSPVLGSHSYPAHRGERFSLLSPCQPVKGRDASCSSPWLRLSLGPQDARLSPESTIRAPNPEPPIVSSEGQLLAWALSAYGGITSYSELQDPRKVQLRLGEGVWGWGPALGGWSEQEWSSCSRRVTTSWGRVPSLGRCHGD